MSMRFARVRRRLGLSERESASNSVPPAARRYAFLRGYRPFARIWVGGALLLSAVLLAITVLGERGLLASRALRLEARQLEAQQRTLHDEARFLEEQILALRSDEGYLAFLARRDLALLKPRETLILLAPHAEDAATHRRAAKASPKEGALLQIDVGQLPMR